jgi:hypothetical protein
LTDITGITQGIATQGVVLFPGINNDISGIGALSCSSLTVDGSSVVAPPSYVVGITPGTAANNKVLVLDGSGAIATITSLTATNIYGSIETGAQTSTTSVGMLTNLALNTGSTGLLTPNIQFWNSITSLYDNFNHSAYIGFSYGGAVASKALVVDANKDIGSIRNLSCTGKFTASTSISTPSITTDAITKAGTQSMTATLNINPTTLQIRGTTLSATAMELNALSGLTASSAELNYNDITTLGAFQVSQMMTLNASGRGLMPLGTVDTNCLRCYGGTAFRETINAYLEGDTARLTIASKTSAASINKTYPLLRLISIIDPSNLGTGNGVAATTDDLLRIDWYDKPSGGFTSQTHRLSFDVGATRPYYSGAGFAHTFGIATSANCFSINVAGSSAVPSGDCPYIIADTINKMLYTTTTPYTNATYGTANITMNDFTLYIKSSHDLNDGSANYDMPLFIASSNSLPVEFAIPIHNGAKSTSANQDDDLE